MKTNAKLYFLGAVLAATAATATAQQFVVRADAGVAGASKGPYDSGGPAITLYFGRTLDAAGMHEISFSIGAMGWDESEVDRSHDNGPGMTTLWINDVKFALLSDNSHFDFRNGNMTIDNGSVYQTSYRPTLTIVPLMANYRLSLGRTDDPVRFFVGAGAGIAELGMESKLWRRFEFDNGGWGWSDRDTDYKWSFTWNATAGVSIRVARNISVDVRYAFQQVQGSTFHMRAVSYQLDNMKVSMGSVGATWRF